MFNSVGVEFGWMGEVERDVCWRAVLLPEELKSHMFVQ